MATETFLLQKPANGTSHPHPRSTWVSCGRGQRVPRTSEIRGRSSYTLHSYAVGLADFLGWLYQSGIDADDVTRHVAGQYIADFGNSPKGGFAGTVRTGTKRLPRTVNHRLSVLASYFGFLIRRDDEAGAGPWLQRTNPISTEIANRRHGMTGRDADNARSSL